MEPIQQPQRTDEEVDALIETAWRAYCQAHPSDDGMFDVYRVFRAGWLAKASEVIHITIDGKKLATAIMPMIGGDKCQ